MFCSTLQHLRCLHCAPEIGARLESSEAGAGDILWGSATCTVCKADYPILAGVLFYVRDVETALIRHIKGITRLVGDERIPEAHAAAFFEARESLAEEGFFDQGLEEDLESERVNALYVMNHFLTASQVPRPEGRVMQEIVDTHWDHGPLRKAAQWILKHRPGSRVIEFGSSVGGLAQALAGGSYLGLDASFASVAVARHLVLGAPYPDPIRIPGDLLEGPVSIEAPLPRPACKGRGESVDFVLADINEVSLAPACFDVSVAIGLIDMLDDPSVLVRRQLEVLDPASPGGPVALQASPCIWHEPVARVLREQSGSSAAAVLGLYEKAGLRAIERVDGMPWVFYKHARQVELYSVLWSVHALG